MKDFKMLFVIIFILCFFSFPAPARDAQDVTKNGPCHDDIMKFCENVKPGKGRVLRCMRQYDKHLSDACRDHIGEVKEKTRKFAKACREDTRKFCADVEAGRGTVYRCLKQHQTELSAVCVNQVK